MTITTVPQIGASKNEQLVVLKADELSEALSAARSPAGFALKPSTQRAYGSDWRHFEAWCQRLRVCSLPASDRVVLHYLDLELRQYRRAQATLRRRLAAIDLVHKWSGSQPPSSSPDVKAILFEARRYSPVKAGKKAPFLASDIKRMADVCGCRSYRALRDRALILFGYAAAMRRSELVALDQGHLDFRQTANGKAIAGVLVDIPNSNGNELCASRQIAVWSQPNSRYCPVSALLKWLTVEEAGNPAVFVRVSKSDGLLFRGRDGSEPAPRRLTGQSVALVVKNYAKQLNLDPMQYAGGSFRFDRRVEAPGRQLENPTAYEAVGFAKQP